MRDHEIEREDQERYREKVRSKAGERARRDGQFLRAAIIESGSGDDDSYVEITEAIFFTDWKGAPTLAPVIDTGLLLQS